MSFDVEPCLGRVRGSLDSVHGPQRITSGSTPSSPSSAPRSSSAPLPAGTTARAPRPPRSPPSAPPSTPSRSPSLDPEDFYDFQVNRPQISLADGQTREVDWPANIFFAAPAPGAERDLVLLTGIEPNNRWRTFAEAILFAAERLEVEMMVSPRRAHRRRRPHPPGADHRPRLATRSWSSGSTSHAPATRARPGSSASSTTPAASAASSRRASGRPSLTTWRRCRTRRPRWRCCGGSRRSPASRSRPPSSRTRASQFEDQINRAVEAQHRDRGARPPARGAAGGRRPRARRRPLRRRLRAGVPAVSAAARDRLKVRALARKQHVRTAKPSAIDSTNVAGAQASLAGQIRR